MPQLTCHAAVNVGFIKVMTNAQLREHRLTNNQEPMPYDGIWIFGGKNQDGKAKGNLYLLKYTEGILRVNKVRPHGQGPSPRYNHCMTHIQKKNMLVILGGRNDEKYSIELSNSYDDLFVMDYKFMVWCKVKMHGNGFGSRYNFCVNANSNQLLVIGGISDGLLVDQTPCSVIVDIDHPTLNMLKETFKTFDSYNPKSSMRINQQIKTIKTTGNFVQEPKFVNGRTPAKKRDIEDSSVKERKIGFASNKVASSDSYYSKQVDESP